ncbi:MAG: hypothetical protein JO189_29440 [Deltaproteobacteria bacterium]|nr:hypothetical protein [Deltaproteobacteria bacterium]
MSPELIAILVTSFIEIVGLVIIAWMAHDNAKILERVDGVSAAIFLQGRQIKEAVEEVRRLLVSEAAHSPER